MFDKPLSPLLDFIDFNAMPFHRRKVDCQWALAGAAIALVGIALSTYAASEQAAAQRRAAKLDEKFRFQEADSAQQAAAFEEKQHRRSLALLLGKQAAIEASSGLDPSSGSPFLETLDTVKQGELSALNIRRGGDVAAAGRLMEARMARLRGSQVPSTGTIAFGGFSQAVSSKGGQTILSSMYSSGGGGGGYDVGNANLAY